MKSFVNNILFNSKSKDKESQINFSNAQILVMTT